MSMQLSVGIFRLTFEEVRTSNAASTIHANSLREGVILLSLWTGSIRNYSRNDNWRSENTYRWYIGNSGQHRREFYFFRRLRLIFGENRNQVVLGVVHANACSARPSGVVLDVCVHSWRWERSQYLFIVENRIKSKFFFFTFCNFCGLHKSVNPHQRSSGPSFLLFFLCLLKTRRQGWSARLALVKYPSIQWIHRRRR